MAAPILAIVYSFSYPAFYAEGRKDPLHILGFGVAHLALVIIALGFILPRWFDILVPAPRRNDGEMDYAPRVTLGSLDAEMAEQLESGSQNDPVDEREKKDESPQAASTDATSSRRESPLQ